MTEVPLTDLIWPNLELMDIEFDVKASDGGWYFLPGRPHGQKDDNEEADEDEDGRDKDEMSGLEIEKRR